MKSIPTIHLVDREPKAHDRMMSLAKALNMQCRVFLSAREYLDWVSQVHPGCLVMDLDLPDMSGLALQQAIRHGPAPLPIVVVTASTTLPIAVEMMQEGAVTVLEKTCACACLKRAISQAVDIDQSQRDCKDRWKVLQSCYQSLSPRECQVLSKIVQGQLNKTIALEMDLSQRTIELDKAGIKRKFQANTLCELSAKYTEYRLFKEYRYPLESPSKEILRKSAIMDLQPMSDMQY